MEYKVYKQILKIKHCLGVSTTVMQTDLKELHVIGILHKETNRIRQQWGRAWIREKGKAKNQYDGGNYRENMQINKEIKHV